MPTYSPDNQYRGVNAHLHSYFQGQSGWSGFHTDFIGALAHRLDRLLPTDFIVQIESSLQIREIHPDSGERIRRPTPDLTIYRTREVVETGGGSGAVATLIQLIPETLDLNEDLYYSAVVIYRTTQNQLLGQAVTRIELLSPTNKSGDGAIQYREKRFAALKSGVALVEIDLLHETPPVVKGIPRYPIQPGSHPYAITVSDPTPSFDEGTAQTYGFDVDMPIRSFDVPLGSGMSIELDMNPVYNEVFGSMKVYSICADYAVLPLNIERYSAADQERIRQVMLRVTARP
jgi:hypothetical protein